MFWTTFGSVGGCGGPEMAELLCDWGVACVYGLESGKGGSALMGLMCCLLHLYLQPWASMMYGLLVLAQAMMVPSRYDV